MSAYLERERRTVAAMIQLYCRARHGSGRELCADCAALLRYAGERLAHCPFQKKKPICAHCAVHCYAPEQRERMRAIMRYAGPRMLWRHPWLAVAHVVGGWRR